MIRGNVCVCVCMCVCVIITSQKRELYRKYLLEDIRDERMYY